MISPVSRPLTHTTAAATAAAAAAATTTSGHSQHSQRFLLKFLGQLSECPPVDLTGSGLER